MKDTCISHSLLFCDFFLVLMAIVTGVMLFFTFWFAVYENTFQIFSVQVFVSFLFQCFIFIFISLQVLPPPAGYVPIRTPARKLTATPTPLGGMTGFHMQTEDRTMKSVNDQPSGNLPFLKPDDIQYFDKLLVNEILLILI